MSSYIKRNMRKKSDSKNKIIEANNNINKNYRQYTNYNNRNIILKNSNNNNKINKQQSFNKTILSYNKPLNKKITSSSNNIKYTIKYNTNRKYLPLSHKLNLTNKIQYNNRYDENNNNQLLYNKNNINTSHNIKDNNERNRRRNHNFFERITTNTSREISTKRNERLYTFLENKFKNNNNRSVNNNNNAINRNINNEKSIKSARSINTPKNEEENNNKKYHFNTQIRRTYKSSIKRNLEYIDNNKRQNIKKNNINENIINNNFKKNEISIKTKNDEILFNVIKKEIGIKNIGNTCFINSCLQVLIHCPLLIYKLIKKIKLINENTPVTSNFISICKIMANTEEKAIDISDFKNLLGIKHKLYEGYLQNDSQEFCRILLEDISRELNEVKGIPIYRILSNSDKISKKLRDNDFYINFNQREKSIITELFYAQIVNIFTCECNSEIYSFQKLLDFPLLFPDNIDNNLITIEELLKLYFEIEYIDFDIECEKCKQKAKHKKEIKISRPPEILILSLQRINESNNSKLRYLVNFPQNLDINEFVDQDCGFARECKYHLFAVINHVGSINSGHYYSYIKIENKDWLEFNDSIVNNIENISDSSESVYALFYIKQKYIINNKMLKFR